MSDLSERCLAHSRVIRLAHSKMDTLNRAGDLLLEAAARLEELEGELLRLQRRQG